MKNLLLICAALLFLSVLKLPIGFYTFLRIIVSITAIAVIAREYNNKLTFWTITFGIIAILFNPVIPIYLNNKSAWMPIDVLVGIVFIIKSFNLKRK